MKNEMSFLIFKQSAMKFGQRLFEFIDVITPANALIINSSFLIFNSYQMLRRARMLSISPEVD
jgi:hypothetical protein